MVGHDQPVVISMHMEKCGGTSLDRLLRSEYGSGFHLYDRGPPEVAAEPPIPATARCVHGHMFYGLHDRIPERRCQYITLLRDPVDRFLSNFRHVRAFEHPLHESVSGAGGLAWFCTASDARPYRNLFVRRLAGVWGRIERADLERAEALIRSFAVVGRIEAAEHFVAACADRYRWRQRRLAHHNSGSKPQPAPTERKLAREANLWDLQLMDRIADLIEPRG